LGTKHCACVIYSPHVSATHQEEAFNRHHLWASPEHMMPAYLREQRRSLARSVSWFAEQFCSTNVTCPFMYNAHFRTFTPSPSSRAPQSDVDEDSTVFVDGITDACHPFQMALQAPPRFLGISSNAFFALILHAHPSIYPRATCTPGSRIFPVTIRILLTLVWLSLSQITCALFTFHHALLQGRAPSS
jgi:hypothetical protein